MIRRLGRPKNYGWSQLALWASLAFDATFSLSCLGQVSTVKPGESILFFPSICHPTTASNKWEVELQGMIYEPEKRGLALALLRKTLEFKDVDLSPAQSRLLAERARLFMVDHKGGRRVVVKIGSSRFDLGKSGADGHFRRRLHFDGTELARLGQDTITYEAVLRADDARRFTGCFDLVPETGLTVISDIDDTIKITGCTQKKQMLRSTFLEPFAPVPGMPEFYKSIAGQRNARFFYVSASPWALFEPLSAFICSNNLPAGTFLLKKVRFKDRSLLALFEEPGKFKKQNIEPLLRQFPRRSFILVGDSGQQDPETYAEIAREFPSQIQRILIRDVTNESADAARYQRLLKDLPAGLFRVFRDPAAMRECCP
jgi:hypothetical protein